MMTVIYYGAGNLRSVANAITRLGHQQTVTDRPGARAGADPVSRTAAGAIVSRGHRGVGAGGSPTGERGGSERKRALQEREGANATGRPPPAATAGSGSMTKRC